MSERPGITDICCLVLVSLLVCFLIFGCGRQIVIPPCEYTGYCKFDDPLGEKTEKQQRILSVADTARAYYEARTRGESPEADRLEKKIRNAGDKVATDKFWGEIRAGQVVAGMSPVEVLSAWGQPDFAGEEVSPSYGFFDYLACGNPADSSIPLKDGRTLPLPDNQSYSKLVQEIQALFANNQLYFTQAKQNSSEPPFPESNTVVMADGYIRYQKARDRSIHAGYAIREEWDLKIVFSQNKRCYTQRVRFKDTKIGSRVKDIVHAVGDQRHLRPLQPIEGEDVKLPAAQNHKLRCIVALE